METNNNLIDSNNNLKKSIDGLNEGNKQNLANKIGDKAEQEIKMKVI